MLPAVWLALDKVIDPYMALKFWDCMSDFGLTVGIPIHLDRSTLYNRVYVYAYLLKPSVAFVVIGILLNRGFRVSVRPGIWIAGAIGVVVLSVLGVFWSRDQVPVGLRILTSGSVAGMLLCTGVNSVYRKTPQETRTVG